MKLFKKISAVVMVVVMSLMLVACGSSKSDSDKSKTSTKYGGVIDKLCDAKINADVEEFMGLFGSMESLMRDVVTQEVLDQTKATYEETCGDDLEVSYKVKEETKATDDDISSYEETIALFGEEGDISEAYDLTIDATVKGSKGDYDYEMALSVGKVNDEWIIVNFNDTLLK